VDLACYCVWGGGKGVEMAGGKGGLQVVKDVARLGSLEFVSDWFLEFGLVLVAIRVVFSVIVGLYCVVH